MNRETKSPTVVAAMENRREVVANFQACSKVRRWLRDDCRDNRSAKIASVNGPLQRTVEVTKLEKDHVQPAFNAVVV
ncbi:hypothetical protein AC249_AIPGENE26288 [Exaiptasia diaphana]|nr:hypothetical protein AC249_AIPGENE26288 [Exaiptasia diaphana]